MKHRFLSIAVATIFFSLVATPAIKVNAATPTAGTGPDSKMQVKVRPYNSTNPPVGIVFENTYTFKVEYIKNSLNEADPVPSTLTQDIHFVSEGLIERFGGYTVGQTPLDLSGIKYTKPGVYEFRFTQVGTSNPDAYPGLNYAGYDKSSYRIRATVTNTNPSAPNGELSVVYTRHEDTMSAVKLSDDFMFSFTEIANVGFIYFGVGLRGNFADVNQCFEYEVDLSNLPDGDYRTYFYRKSGAYAMNNTSCDNGGFDNYKGPIFNKRADNTKMRVKLRHDWYVQIGDNSGNGTALGFYNGDSQILGGSKVTITQITDEGYLTSMNGAQQKSIEITPKVPAFNGSWSNIKVDVINERESPSQTGIILSVAPFLLTLGIGLFGVMIVIKRKRSE